MVFHPNSRRLLVGQVLVMLNDALSKHGDRWTLAATDAATVVGPILKPPASGAGNSVVTVVLDPGHGGKDCGAIGHRRIAEKKVTLDVAKRVRKSMKDSGLRVKLTRSRDSSLPLGARVARAKSWNADVFVSIHANSAANKNAAGLETYVMTAVGFASTSGGRIENKPQPGNSHDVYNMALAYSIHRQVLAQAGCADRGIRHARFDVLRDASCPAVLVECAFLSNPAEAARVLKRSYRNTLAKGIAQGILEYVALTRR